MKIKLKMTMMGFTIALSGFITTIILESCYSKDEDKNYIEIPKNNPKTPPETPPVKPPIKFSEFLDDVRAVSAGSNHTLAIRKDNTVWAFGGNDKGQLGLGDNTSTNRAKQITSLSDASAVAAGIGHTLVVKNDGTLWTFGNNTEGELGLGNNTNFNLAQNVTFSDNKNNNVQAVAAGGEISLYLGNYQYYGHSLVLKNDGTVWVFGVNRFGQLGLGFRSNSNSPTKINNLTDAIAISAGKLHSLILKSDGTVLATGNNANGQLGLDLNTSRTNNFTLNPTLTDIIAIAAGEEYSLALDKNNNVWVFGYNANGQLGLTTTTLTTNSPPVIINNFPDIKAIAAGINHSLALNKDGSLWSFGNNESGELGLGTNLTTVTPTKIDSLGNEVSAMSSGKASPLNSNRFVSFSIALKNNGTLWSFGNNKHGQLGTGNNDSTSNPTQVKKEQ